MWGVTGTWTCKVEFCQEQEPRATSGTVAEMWEVLIMHDSMDDAHGCVSVTRGHEPMDGRS